MVKFRLPKLFPPKQSKYLDVKGNPKTIIVTGGAGGTGTGGKITQERNDKQLQSFWDYYQGEGIIFASISITAWNTVMVGYYLTSDDEKAKETVQKALEATDLDGAVLDNVIYTLVFGDAFIEKREGTTEGKEPIKYFDLKTVDPMTMYINTDKYGMEVDYQQKIGGTLLPTKLKPEDIIHFNFFPQPSKPYGLSIIQPSIDTIDRKVATDESLANAIQRHGTTKYVVKIGNDEEVPPESVFNSVKAKLEDIDAQNEFIIPGLVDIKTIDEKGIQGVKEYSDYFQTQLIVGLLCPEEALGQGRGSTEATSKVKEIMYERFIKSIQHKIAANLKDNLINPILEANGMEMGLVTLRFNSVTDADEAVKAKWLGNLLRGYPDQAKPFTLNEIRAVFDYPPIEGGETNEMPYAPRAQPTGDEKPEGGKEAPSETGEGGTPPKNTEQQKKEESRYRNLRLRLQDLEDEIESLKDSRDRNG